MCNGCYLLFCSRVWVIHSMWDQHENRMTPSDFLETCSRCWDIKQKFLVEVSWLRGYSVAKMCVAKMWGFLQFWPTLHHANVHFSWSDCCYEKLIVCSCSISIRLLFDMHKMCFLVRLGSKINLRLKCWGVLIFWLYVVITFLFIPLYSIWEIQRSQ